ncbi:MAG: putative tricarboxylic transport membrane protein [Alphaproteobacteria bacterium]|jgi:putative tricarboxylic transport membrane protein
MFEAVIDGLMLVVQWPAPAYLLLGVMLGMFFGAVPGLSGLVGMAILLPFTFGMAPGSAFAFLLGMYAVTTTADTLSSVMLGVPGTAASQATILDGYPMAQRGEASRALGAAYTVSMIGGVLGAVFLAVSIPIVKPLILSFAEPEFFMLAVLGLTMVGSLSGGSIFKGMASACFGLLLGLVGYSAFGGVPRYTFEANYLLDGLPLVPVVLGLFALPEMIDLASRGASISRVAQAGSGMMDGVRDAGRHWWLGIRCTAIGVYIGMLPGLGGSIVDWVAYGHAVQSAKDKSQFGKGDIRGVIAPEAANNAMKGGALLPTIAFAIPGSAAMAILLSAFLIQGLEPGPQMLTTSLDISFSLVWTLVIANILGAGLLMAWGNQVAKLTFLPGHYLVPAILLFVFMGAWIGNGVLGDWISLLVFGLIGWVMKISGWSRPPMVLGFILGIIMENGLHIGMQTYGWDFITRPIVLIIVALILFTLITAWRKANKNRADGNIKEVGDGADIDNPRLALPFDILLLVIFAGAAMVALTWVPAARFMPLVATLPAIALLLIIIWRDAKAVRERKAIPAGPEADAATAHTAGLLRGGKFYLWMLGIVGATLIIGQYIALVCFVALYLRVWGKVGWRLTLVYTAVSAAVLYLLFNMVVPVLWHESPFFSLFN